MWDEDPRWQEGNYRFLMGAIVVSTLLATIGAIMLGEWATLLSWLYILVVIAGSLSVYAAIVWVIGNSFWQARQFIQKLKRRS